MNERKMLKRRIDALAFSIHELILFLDTEFYKVYSKINEGTEFIFTIPIVKIAEDTVQDYDVDRKVKHVERCDIEFSDIYSI